MPCEIAPLLAPQGPVVAAIRTRLANAMAIYAFGSQVQGTAGSQSDLDLAGSLADVVGCPVDLLDLRAADGRHSTYRENLWPMTF